MYLERTVAPGDAVGTAWGVTLREVARHLRPRPLSDVTVVQLMGGLHADGLVNPPAVSRGAEETVDGRQPTWHAPPTAEARDTRATLPADDTAAQPRRG